MSAKLLYYYFGDDEAYFKALQSEFQKSGKESITFQRFYEPQESKIQGLFLKVFTAKPAVVFIDFSKQTADYLHLARLLARTSFEHKLLMVGLLDYLSPPEILKESIATGAHLSFIKGPETFDVAFSVAKLSSASGGGEHGFANCSLKEEFEAGILCKVGYAGLDGIHIETDHRISKGDRLILSHHWLEKRVVPSRQVFVKDVGVSNMFYQFKLNADIDFLFMDDFIPYDGMDPAEISERLNEREENVTYQKKQLKKWIDENRSDASQKRAKLLVVDYKFHFYQGQPRTDKHSYTIRCIPFFADMKLELDRFQPQIIAYELQTTENSKNTLDNLKELISVYKASNPYIIVFNSPSDSPALQTQLGFSQILAHKEELSPDLLIKMADALQKKLSNVTVSKNDSHKAFLKKSHSSSMAEIRRSVTIVKMSESDMIIQSDYAFSAGENLHFTEPVEMFVHVTPSAKPSGKVPEYYGLIHCIGKTDKKELRRYVNSIFFREHDAKVTSETDEFKKLNELKLQEKIADAIKAQQEAAENPPPSSDKSKDPAAS